MLSVMNPVRTKTQCSDLKKLFLKEKREQTHALEGLRRRHSISYEWSIEADTLPDDDEQGLNNCQNSPETYLSFWNV